MRRSPCALGVALTTLILSVTLLAGCALPSPFPQPTPDPKLPDSQQILRQLDVGPASGDLEALDPALIEFTVDQNLGQLIFPQLVTLDEQSQPVDSAAQSHEVSADGLTYTFHLRKGMSWSDGTPIDANTFAYSINRALDPCTQSPVANYLYPIKGAQAFNSSACPAGATKSGSTLVGSALLVPDPLTLQIVLQQPAGYFLTVLTNPIAWGVPQTLVERYAALSTSTHYVPANSTWTDHLADHGGFGGNLYKVVTWTHLGNDGHAQVTLERNEHFWGQKPLLRRIEYTLYKSLDAAWPDFIAGEGDISQPPLTEFAAAKSLKGVTIQQAPLLSVSWLKPNWRIAPFDDLRIRQALFLAIDRTRLAHEIFADTVIPSIHLVPEGLLGYNAALADPAGRRGQDALAANQAAARALGDAYVAEKCAGDVAKCAPIVLHCRAMSQSAERVYQMIEEDWQEIFPQWPFEIFCAHCSAIVCTGTTIQLDKGGWLADYPDPQDFLSLLWSTSGTYNESYVSIPAADALCAQADASTDQHARVSRYQQAEQLLITQGAAIPLYQNETTYAVRSRVADWHVAPTGMTPLSVWQQVYVKR